MKALYTLILILFINFTHLSAQQIVGKVVDNQEIPLQGAIVEIPELNKITVTDKDGFFKLSNLPKNELSLQVKFVGFKTEILKVNPTNQKKLNIKLQPSYIQTDEVVISGGNFSPSHTNAVKVQTIEFNASQVDANISGFLTKIPGIDMIQKGNGVTKPVIRGLSGTNILVLKNGFRIENYQFDQDHPFIFDKNGNDRIEVIKGPASLLYGSDAIGGIINLISDKPAPIDHISGDIVNTYFTNGNGLNNSFDIKASKSKLMWGISGKLRSQKDIYDGDSKQILNSRFFNKSAKMFLILNTKKNYTQFNYEYIDYKLGMTVPPALPLITDNTRYNRYFYQNLHNHFASFKNTFFVTSNFRIKTNVSYENNLRQLKIVDTLNPQIGMNLQNINYQNNFELSLNKIDLISGFQGYYTQNKNQSIANGKIIPNYNLNSNAAFAYMKFKYIKNVFLQTGIRYEFSKENLDLNNFYDFTQNDTTLNYKNLSASLGMTMNIWKYFNIRLNYASGYRMPNIAELTQNGIHDFRYQLGDFNLKSQKNQEIDFSVHFHSKKMLIDFATFYNQIDNYIYLSRSNDTASNGMQIFKYMQTNANIYGFETGMQYSPIHKLNFTATYNYLVAKEKDGYLPMIPQNKLRMNVNYTLPDFLFVKNLNIEVANLYAFAQNNIALLEEASPAYDLINININFNTIIANQKIIWTIGSNNVLNTTYNDHLSTLADAGFYDMGRTIFFSIDIPFDFKY